MPFDIWTTEELFAVRQDDRMNPIPSFFLDTFFSQTFFAEDQEIKFADLPEADRFLAPFVLPTEQGKPIYNRRGESISAFTPAYIKLKNGVRPQDARNLLPSDALRNRSKPLSLEERFNLRVVQLMEQHLRMIRTREAWMAARAILDAKVQIDYERDQGGANPSVLLDFGRNADQTIVKGADYWNDPATDILGDLETWANRMYLANGGGTPNMIVVGARVAPVFKRNTGIIAAMNKENRGNDSNGVDIRTGIQRLERPFSYIGKLDNGMEVWTYKDTVDIPNGLGGKTKIDLMDERDVLMLAPGATGVRAYGAIYDAEAMIEGVAAQTDIYSKMFTTKDPGELFLMNQSSPLPIPLYPNRTLKARVLV